VDRVVGEEGEEAALLERRASELNHREEKVGRDPSSCGTVRMEPFV
jgi:hypothetical protein